MDSLQPLRDFLGVAEMTEKGSGGSVDFVSAQFPKIFSVHGPALHVTNGSVKRISEDFFAELLGSAGQPDCPVVFIPEENRFYQYDPSVGVYGPVSAVRLHALLSSKMRELAARADIPAASRTEFPIRF